MTDVNTEYKETRAGPKKLQIPKEWEVRDLGELVSRLTNGISESQSKDDTGFPVTRIETIAQGWVNHDKVGYVDAEKSEYSDYRLEEGDVLFSHINSIPHIGKTAQYQGEKELYHGMNLLLIRFDEEEIEQEYGYIYLNSKLARDFWVSNCKQAVNQASLNQGEVESLPVIIPSRPEQRRIAEILSTVDEAIQQTDEIIETSKELKKGLMQDLLTKGIGHDEFKEVQLGPKKIEIPEKWSKYKLEDISNIITRGKQPNYVEKSNIEVVNQSCIYWDGFHRENVKYLDEETAEDWKDKYFLHENDVLINSTGKGTLGRVLHWERDTDNFVIDSHVTRVDLKKDLADAGYLRYYLESSQGQEAIFTFCVSGSTGQIELSKGDLTTVPLILPPLDEQREIAEKLSTVDEKIRQEEEYKKKLEELKKGLMQDLLTGEKRVEV